MKYSIIIIFFLIVSSFATLSGTITGTGPTGDKPQSKCWFAHNSWWCVTGGKIFRQESDTNFVEVQTIATNITYDALWNGENLFLIGTSWSTQRFFKYSFNETDSTYTLLDGFPIIFSKVTNTSLGSPETIVMDQDSLGRIWATFEIGLTIKVIWTTNSEHTEWNIDGHIVGRDVYDDDISTIVKMPGNVIGIFWSNQSDDKFHFRYHNSNDHDTVWSEDEIAYNSSDDHMNCAVSSDGRLFVAVKTAYPLLLVRSISGTWTSYEKASTGGTRPIVMYSSVNDEILFYSSTAESGSPVVCYRMPSTNIVLANPDTIIKSPTARDISGTKQILDSVSGSLVIAQEGGSTTTSAHFHHIDLSINNGTIAEDMVNINNLSLNVYPNPFNPVTNIFISGYFVGVQNFEPIQISIYNISGRLVYNHLDKVHESSHTIQWNATTQPSGIYMVKMKIGNKIFSKHITLLK